MFETFFPDEYVASTYVIPFEKLYEEGALLETHEFFLEVRESNEAAIELYSRQGFVKEGIRKNFYERPVENAVIMWRR